MEFHNQAVHPNDLPSINEVVFSPLEKDYLFVERITFTISITVILAAAAALIYFIDAFREDYIIYSAIAVFCLLSVLICCFALYSFYGKIS